MKEAKMQQLVAKRLEEIRQKKLSGNHGGKQPQQRSTGCPELNIDAAARSTNHLKKHPHLGRGNKTRSSASGAAKSHMPYFQWKHNTDGSLAKEFEKCCLQKTTTTAQKSPPSGVPPEISEEGEEEEQEEDGEDVVVPTAEQPLSSNKAAGGGDNLVPFRPVLVRHRCDDSEKVKEKVKQMINQKKHETGHVFILVNTPVGQECDKEFDFEGKDNVFIIAVQNLQNRELARVRAAMKQQNIRHAHFFPPPNFSSVFGSARIKKFVNHHFQEVSGAKGAKRVRFADEVSPTVGDKRENYAAVRQLLPSGVKARDTHNLLNSVEEATQKPSTVLPHQEASAETHDLEKQDLKFVVYDDDKKEFKQLCCKKAHHLRLEKKTELIAEITNWWNLIATTKTNTTNAWKNGGFFIKQIKEERGTPLQSLGEAILSSHLGTQGCGPQNTELYYENWEGGSNTHVFYLKTDVADNDLDSWFKGQSTETKNSNKPVFKRHDHTEVQLMAKACKEATHKISYEARVWYWDDRPANWVYTQGESKNYTVLACDSGAGFFFVPTKDHDLDLLHVSNVVFFLWGCALSISKSRNSRLEDRKRRFYKDLVCCLEKTAMSSDTHKSVLKSHTFLHEMLEFTIETFKELDPELNLFSQHQKQDPNSHFQTYAFYLKTDVADNNLHRA